MALTILPGYTDQQVQLNILVFCDLTETYDSAQNESAHLFGVLSGGSYGSHIIIVLESSPGGWPDWRVSMPESEPLFLTVSYSHHPSRPNPKPKNPGHS